MLRALLGMRVEKGDRVGIWAPNIVEWLVVQKFRMREISAEELGLEEVASA